MALFVPLLETPVIVLFTTSFYLNTFSLLLCTMQPHDLKICVWTMNIKGILPGCPVYKAYTPTAILEQNSSPGQNLFMSPQTFPRLSRQRKVRFWKQEQKVGFQGKEDVWPLSPLKFHSSCRKWCVWLPKNRWLDKARLQDKNTLSYGFRIFLPELVPLWKRCYPRQSIQLWMP